MLGGVETCCARHVNIRREVRHGLRAACGTVYSGGAVALELTGRGNARDA